MSEACITNDFEDINFTDRDVIGYSFEVLISKLLNKSGIDYTANPLDDIKLWKQYQGKGSDFKIPSLNIELEAKSGYARIYRSWILRDWIPRFSYHNEIRIVIVKPTLKLSDQVLDLLFSYNINVIYPDSMSYLIDRGNKLVQVDSNDKNSVLEGTLLNGYDLKCISHLKCVSKSNVNSKNETKSPTLNANSKNGTEWNGIRTEEKTESSTSREDSVSTTSVGMETKRLKLKEISFGSKEISPSLGKISTVSVKIRAFYNRLKTSILNLFFNLFHDTSGRLPKTRKWIMSGYGNRSILEYCSDKMKRSKLHPIIKTCPYKTVLVCKMKYFKPKYVCGFPFQNKIRYCDYCEDRLDEDNMDLYGRPICEYYNERCDVILQSYEYINLENSQICYWISRSERVKVLRELEKYRGENRCPNKH